LARATNAVEVGTLNIPTRLRNRPAQWLSEGLATFGLVVTILATLRGRPEAVPTAVVLFITAACWFTVSTSFINPAAAIARGLTDTFSGIAALHMPVFIVTQLADAITATALMGQLLPSGDSDIALTDR